MTVVGSVGGSNASAGNKAFSEGFGWANFDLLSTDDPNSRRSDDEDSDVYACSMATKGGVVAGCDLTIICLLFCGKGFKSEHRYKSSSRCLA